MAYQSRSKSATQGKEETAQMDYTHTEAHQMAYDFSVYLHEKMKKFPHYEKFTLQKDIRESIDGILDEIEMFEITKVASHLYAADRLKKTTGTKDPTCLRSGIFGHEQRRLFLLRQTDRSDRRADRRPDKVDRRK